MSSSSFISTEQAKVSKSGEIIGDPWFPSVSVSELDNLYRLTGSVSQPIQENLLCIALLTVCGELKELKTQNPTIVDFYGLPHVVIGNRNSTEIDFANAVYAHAKSLVTEQYRDFDSTAKGHERADEVDLSTDHYRRQSRESIRRLLGKTRISADLI